MSNDKKRVEYRGEIYEVENDVGTPAINIEGSGDEHCHVTISHNVISRDGFKPLTLATQRQTKMIMYLVVAVALVVLAVVLC